MLPNKTDCGGTYLLQAEGQRSRLPNSRLPDTTGASYGTSACDGTNRCKTRATGGENVPYGYSYLFAYGIDLAPGARTVKLPNNQKIRVLAMSVVQQSPELRAVQPLYDLLPSSQIRRDVSFSGSTDRLPP
jgi:hypothetical protein